jgi:hypothetical protein
MEWIVEAKWPADVDMYSPQLLVTAYPRGAEIAVTVELRYDEKGPYVIGIAARGMVQVIPFDPIPRSVSPRDVKRLPLARYVDAALAFAATAEKPTEENDEFREGKSPTITGLYPDATVRTYYAVGAHSDWREAGFQVPEEMVVAGQVLVPGDLPKPGRPNRTFYKWIADEHRRHTAAHRSAAKEIASATGAHPNTVHQWIHRARELGDLEQSPRSRRRSGT